MCIFYKNVRNVHTLIASDIAVRVKTALKCPIAIVALARVYKVKVKKKKRARFSRSVKNDNTNFYCANTYRYIF